MPLSEQLQHPSDSLRELYKESYGTYREILERRQFSKVNEIISDSQRAAKLIPTLIVGLTSPYEVERSFAAYVFSKIDKIDDSLIFSHLYRMFDLENKYFSLLAISLYERSRDASAAINYLSETSEKILTHPPTDPLDAVYEREIQKNILSGIRQLAINNADVVDLNPISGALVESVSKLVAVAKDIKRPLDIRIHAIENIGMIGRMREISDITPPNDDKTLVRILEDLSDESVEEQRLRDSVSRALAQLECRYFLDDVVMDSCCDRNKCPQNSDSFIALQVRQNGWEVALCIATLGKRCKRDRE